MTYEIPQELEYKEKIVFGLNFEQLVYLLLFGFVILVILFKLNLNQELKVFLSTLVGVLAICFMFFNLRQKIKDFWDWYKFREFRVAGVRMKRLIPEINIQNNILEVGGKNGKDSNTKSKTYQLSDIE
jgi:hypothetical protein